MAGIKLVHASVSETGGAGWDGKARAGDQTGKEVCTRSWYDKPWDYALRYPDAAIRAKAAEAAVKIANSNLAGYDQSERNTLYFALKGCEWDIDAYIAGGEKTETDCSAFVYAAYACFIPSMRSDNNAPVTMTMRGQYVRWGFEIVRNADFTTGNGLAVGDIVVKAGSHAAMVIETPALSRYSPAVDAAITTLAYDVIAGNWGNGAERRITLYSAIQSRVNALLK